jgi:hypothetical protein
MLRRAVTARLSDGGGDDGGVAGGVRAVAAAVSFVSGAAALAAAGLGWAAARVWRRGVPRWSALRRRDGRAFAAKQAGLLSHGEAAV